LTIAEKHELVLETRLQDLSEGEYVRRRLGFGEPTSSIRPAQSVVQELEKRGIDVAELLSRDYIQQEAAAAGMSEARLVRSMLDCAAAPPAKRQLSLLITAINQLGLELSAIGNNANQISRNKHSGREERLAWQDVVTVIQERCGQVEAALDKVIASDD